MKGWVPVPGSTKGELVLRALEEFGARGYGGVNVVDLAEQAGVTTGSLYHHFGSKMELYEFVLEDVERRIVDRIEGAAAASADGRSAIRAGLLIAFDTAIRQKVARLLAERHPNRQQDPIADAIVAIAPKQLKIRARLLVAAWRESLREAARGEPTAARAALSALLNAAL